MVVAASSERTPEPSGILSAASSTTRIGEAPGTIRTVSWGSSVRTVPIPTSTASHEARKACDSRRSSSPLIHRESPRDVAILPSSVCAYLTTTYGLVARGRTVPSRAPTFGGGLTPSTRAVPIGTECPILSCFVVR